MTTFNVALMQLLPTGSQAGNLLKGLDSCKKAKQIGADLALFPEMWNNGYMLTTDTEETRRDAIPADSDYVLQFQSLAKELDMAIGITFLEDFYTASLDTANGSVLIGAMICYDREFPESARILMLKGAEIVLVPNACPMEINRLSQLRGRAYENMIGIATVNYPHGQPDCNGHSSAFDGIAYRPGEGGARDTMIVEAGEAEGIYMASFPMAEIRDYRRREVHGNAYRRPKKYHALISENKSEPFVR